MTKYLMRRPIWKGMILGQGGEGGDYSTGSAGRQCRLSPMGGMMRRARRRGWGETDTLSV